MSVRPALALARPITVLAIVIATAAHAVAAGPPPAPAPHQHHHHHHHHDHPTTKAPPTPAPPAPEPAAPPAPSPVLTPPVLAPSPVLTPPALAPSPVLTPPPLPAPGEAPAEGSAAEVIEVSGRAPIEAEPTTYAATGDEIRSIPGAANDTLRALQILPGVARLPFSFGGLVLRGTSPRDSHVFVDGIEVPIAFHFGGVTSFYPSAMLDQVELVGGGYGAAYGRGMGGIVTLTTRPARTDGWRMGSEVSLFDSQVRAEGPAAGGGVIVGVRRSYIDAVLAAVMPDDSRVLPRYWDAQLQWSAGDPRGAHGAVTATVFYSDNQITTKDHGSDVSLSSWFVRAAVRYARQTGGTHVEVTPWAGVDSLSFNGPLDTPMGKQHPDAMQQRTTIPIGLRAQVVDDTAWGHLAAGVDLRAAHYGQLAVDVLGQDPFEGMGTVDEWSADAGAWTEAAWRIGGRLVVRPGLRADYYGDTGESVIDPRLATSVEVGDRVVVRQSFGVYHQPPLHPDLDPVSGNPQLKSSWAVQASAGLDAELPGDLALGVTGYAVDQHDLPVAVTNPRTGLEPTQRSTGGLGPIFLQLLDAQLGSYDYRANLGRGKSVGLELSLKRHAGRWLTWLSYTYAIAQRTDDPVRFSGWRPYELDQRHNLNAVVAVRLGGWQLGARAQVTSGIPYTPEIESLDAQGFTHQTEGELLSGRLPLFAALDVRVDHTWTGSWGSIDLYLDVQNATNRDNVEGYSVTNADGSVEYTHGLPILPIIGVAYTPAPPRPAAR